MCHNWNFESILYANKKTFCGNYIYLVKGLLSHSITDTLD